MVEALELKVGDQIDIQIDIQIVSAQAFDVSRAPSRADLLARLEKFRRRLPEGFRFDRLEAHER